MEDHHVAVIGDWMPPSPSPRTFFSSLLADNNNNHNFSVGSKSILDSPKEYENMGLFLGSRHQLHQMVSEKHDYDNFSELDTFSEEVHHKGLSRGGGGLVERIAARAGFNAPRLNTESFRSGDLSMSHDVHAPYLTIPPGLSPTTLLDSPVFLSNSLAQPSPTTGKFPFVMNNNNRSSKLTTDVTDRSNDNHFDDINASSFAFKPVPNSGPSFFPAASNNITSATVSQPFPSIENGSKGFHLHQDFPRDKDTGVNTIGSKDFNVLGDGRELSPLFDEKQDEQGDQQYIKDSSEDVYNWRKYGQKQVKGSEYPRSYFKCTHPNCQVKKKVERSHEGHVTEIIYKGAHNHPKPLPNRKSGTSPFGDTQLDIPEKGGLQSGCDGDLVWTSTQKGTASGAPDWRNDEVAPEFCHQSSGMQAQNIDAGDTVDVSSTFSNEEEEDDRATHGSVSLANDAEGDESESKRRKIEAYASELTGATRAIREPRVVVQTTSEVDILDDGYRWRKYGQKVVKGNPNPRSYYKCTSAGCTVRKHVERASHDLKSVITTYEGKHNHDVPAARNSSHINSANNAFSHQTTMQRPSLSQIHNSMARYGRQQQQMRPSSQHDFSYGVNNHNQPTLGNYAMGINQYLGQQQQMVMNDMAGFMMSKGDMKMEPISESGHNNNNNNSNNLSNSSSVYQQIMNRLPLGP